MFDIGKTPLQTISPPGLPNREKLKMIHLLNPAEPTITVVIPTHNRCELLKETISSVFSQTFNNWELIVVDDASEDSTWSWLQGINDTRIKSFRFAQNSERSKARNKGLQAAKGEFILFLDDDDLLPKRALQTHIEALERNPSVIASIGGHTTFFESGSHLTRRIVRHNTVRHIWQDLLFGWKAVSGMCLLEVRSVKSVGGWDESRIFAEDQELFLRLTRLGPIALLPDIVLQRRMHSGQWHPANMDLLWTKIFEQAVRQVQGRDRKIAESIIYAQSLVQAASIHYSRGKSVKALILYIRGVIVAPGILRSPLTRYVLLKQIIKCLVGRTGVRIWKFLKLNHESLFREKYK